MTLTATQRVPPHHGAPISDHALPLKQMSDTTLNSSTKRKRVSPSTSTSLRCSRSLPTTRRNPTPATKPSFPPLNIIEAEILGLTDFLTSHPQLSAYNPTLQLTTALPPSSITQAVDLVATTSATAYKASSKGWSPRTKRKEMVEPGMRSIVLHFPSTPLRSHFKSGGDEVGSESRPVEEWVVEEEWEDEADVDGDEDGIAAILHYLPTLEPSGNGERKMKTLYIYEIHAHPSLQGRGLGTLLLELADDLAGAMGCEKVMLTVFTSNEGARRLYARHGYEHWDEEVVPVVRRLRGARGRTQGSGMREPSYVILAKDVGTAVTK